MNRFLLMVTAFLVLPFCSTSAASADIVIDGFTDATNDRFTNSNSFVGAGFDFSGVARRTGWSTLISNNVIITAHHAAASGVVRFYPGNDPSATPIERTISGSQQIGSTDLRLRVLDSPVPSSLKIYNFATELISHDPNAGLQSAGSFQGLNSYMIGRSPTDYANIETDIAVGRNQISGYVEDFMFDGNTDNDVLIMLRENLGDPDYVQFESRLSNGDSGAPLFVEDNGELLLLGVNSFNGTTDGGQQLSGVTYIGNHIDEINAFIALNAIPEPSGCGVVLVVGLFAACRRKRSMSR